MKTAKVSAVFVLALYAMLPRNSVRADDYNPPIWRGEERTTYQKWEFGDNNPTPAPDEVTNTQGTPTLAVTGSYPLRAWLDEYLGRTGVWRYEDYVQIEIPNFNEAYPLKEIWLQLTYTEDDPFILTTPEVPMSSITLKDKQATGDYWHVTYQIIIEPNPESETIYIQPTPCTMYIDEIVVDTICIPEPATICLLGLGALALLRKRRG